MGSKNQIELRSLGAERGLLSSIFLKPDILPDVMEKIVFKDFTDDRNKNIYNSLLELYSKGEKADPLLVKERLGKEYEHYLFEILEEEIISTNYRSYLTILKEKSHQRSIKNMLEKAGEALRENEDPKELLATLSCSITEKQLSIESQEKKDSYNSKELMEGFLQRLDSEELNNTIGSCMDGINAKFERGDLNIIAGRPAMGKTVYSLNMAFNQANEGYNVGIFSLEMTPDQLIIRMIQSEGRLQRSSILTGKHTKEEGTRFGAATQKIMGLGDTLRVIDVPGINIQEFCSKVRVEHTKKRFDVIYIDYLQLIEGAKDNGTEYGDVTEISKKLKLLARELDIVIIALAQLNRGVEQRANRRPTLADLRGSGQIEQDASVIQFLYRDEYYNEESEFKGIMEVITGKSRHTAIGTEHQRFFPDIQRVGGYEPITSNRPLKVVKKSG